MARLLACGALVVATTLAGTADAASTFFTGLLDVHAGYGGDPTLTAGQKNGGSGLVGGTLSGTLTRQDARSATTLTGTADVQQSFSKYGRAENYTLSLGRYQRLTEHLTVNGDASYANTINPGISYQNQLTSGALFQNALVAPGTTAAATTATAGASAVSDPATAGTAVTTIPVGTFDPSNLDLFTLGQRSERYSGDVGLSWIISERDQLTLSGNASRVHYTQFSGSYDQYGGVATYLRTLSARTHVGVSGTATVVKSNNYPTARSYGANLVLTQELSSHLTFTGSIGLIVPRDGLGLDEGVSLGFNGSLCGRYTRLVVCATVARQAAPTGIGGLRTDLQGGFSLNYELTEHDRINAGGTADHSSGNSITPALDYYQASAGFSHDVSRRVSVGGSARYQRRSGGGLYGRASGYAVTVDVITRFGHVPR